MSPLPQRFTDVLCIVTSIVLLLFAVNSFADQDEVTLADIASGSLLLKTAHHGRYMEAPVQSTEAEITVTGPIARAVVKQRFKNPTDEWTEATYAFPLPEDAAVDHMRMRVGDRIIEGQIKEKAEAKKVYEKAKREGKRTALVEQKRPNLFTTAVANIPPQGEITVEIEYQHQPLWRDGRFSLRFPMTITPRYKPAPVTGSIEQQASVSGGWSVLPGEVNNVVDLTPSSEAEEVLNPVSLSVHLNTGFELADISSRFHPIVDVLNEDGSTSVSLKDGTVAADRDFELVWQAKAGQSPKAAFFTETTASGHYGLLMIMPPDKAFAAQAQVARETIYIIDTSGSMSGQSMRDAKEALMLAIQRLKPADRFNVIQFNSEAEALFKAPVSGSRDNRHTALRYVAGLDADGGTEMLSALSLAFDMPMENRNASQQVVFITDGAVGNEEELLKVIHDGTGRRALFTVGIGSAPNSYFMTEAARMGRGSFTYIGDVNEVKEKMSALFKRLENPALVNAELNLPVNADVLPNPIPDLYIGEPVNLIMKLDSIPDQASLAGRIGQNAWSTSLTLQAAPKQAGLGVHWARGKIKGWMREKARGADADKVRTEVLSLALANHLVSKYTSLVAVDVTPVRPADASLNAHQLKNKLPKGLKPKSPTQAKQPLHLAMAQGSTSSMLYLISGVLLLLTSLLGLRRKA